MRGSVNVKLEVHGILGASHLAQPDLKLDWVQVYLKISIRLLLCLNINS